MKKTLFFFGCALFVAGMISCNNAQEEPATEEVAVEETVVEEPVAEEPVAVEETATVDKTAVINAAKEAAQAKCNCYKTDPASVEACIRAILTAEYAAYQNDADFQATMEAEYKNCIKEKAADATKKAADKAISAGAEALSKKLQKNN